MLNLIPSDGLDTVLLEPSICKKNGKTKNQKNNKKNIKKLSFYDHILATVIWRTILFHLYTITHTFAFQLFIFLILFLLLPLTKLRSYL